MRSVRYVVDQVRRLFGGYVRGDKMQLAAAAWFRDRGDDRLRFHYPLQTDSVVLDCGGYEGDWAHAIHCKFGCTVHVFEPVPHFAAQIRRRFEDNRCIRVHSFGLQGADEHVPMHISANASSAYGSGNAVISVQMRDVVDVLRDLEIPQVSLIKINIEGGEYDLLDRLIASGCVEHIDHILVQFHNFVPDAVARRNSIRARLRSSHRLIWDYPFIWESWSRIS